jgi:hypothetical protein
MSLLMQVLSGESGIIKRDGAGRETTQNDGD